MATNVHPDGTGLVTARDKAAIAYSTFGDIHRGVPLVLVTGALHLKRDWFDFPLLLSRAGLGRGVVTLDTRGMGESHLAPGQDGTELTLSQWATDVMDVLHSLRISRADLLGWSLGSVVVQHLLLSCPGISSGREEMKVEGVSFPHVVLATSFASPLSTLRRSRGSDTAPQSASAQPGPSLTALREQPGKWAEVIAASLYRAGYAEESDLHKENYDRRQRFLAETMCVRVPPPFSPFAYLDGRSSGIFAWSTRVVCFLFSFFTLMPQFFFFFADLSDRNQSLPLKVAWAAL